MLTEKDFEQIKNLGISKEKVQKQIDNFIKGFPSMKLYKPALVNDGIYKFDEKSIDEKVAAFDDKMQGQEIIKFVPASGAASRMFKDLFAFLSSSEGDIAEGKAEKIFIDDISNFAFIDDLQKVLVDQGLDLDELISKGEYKKTIELVLTEKGLDYSMLPKGLLKFHKYTEGARTAVEEHLVEGALYAKRSDGSVHIHLTVSPEHLHLFEQTINKVKAVYEQKYNVTYNISYSVQKKSTDTIAVDPDNKPFRLDNGTILFRPGGHGALIENLNDIQAGIIFIKNIDNVAPDRVKDVTIRYKKLLASVFIDFQEKIFGYLRDIDAGKNDENFIEELIHFIENELNTVNPQLDKSNVEKTLEYAKNKLNRPLRMCGMVSSEGDTGGGPFWAYNPDGTMSLQIVETAQINLEDPAQKDIFEKATHFNPNDLVCGVKDYKGNKFDLTKYVDQTAGFIAKKSKDGRDLKAQELPGLWNGSMSDWNTVFIEVPIQTFSPVKKVNDLLFDEHQ